MAVGLKMAISKPKSRMKQGKVCDLKIKWEQSFILDMEAIPPTCKGGEIYTDPLSSVDARFQGLSFQDIKSHAAVSPIRYLIVKCSSSLR